MAKIKEKMQSRRRAGWVKSNDFDTCLGCEKMMPHVPRDTYMPDKCPHCGQTVNGNITPVMIPSGCLLVTEGELV